MLEFEVEKVAENDVICKVLNSGTLSSRKGVNIPGINIHFAGAFRKRHRGHKIRNKK